MSNEKIVNDGLLSGNIPAGYVPLPIGLPLWMENIYRQPYRSENEFFNTNRHVAGMAADDGNVILNPFSSIGNSGRRSVFVNELVRLLLRSRPELAPHVSKDQADKFKNYGADQDIRSTSLARIVSGDPSAGEPTFMQSNRAMTLRGLLDIE